VATRSAVKKCFGLAGALFFLGAVLLPALHTEEGLPAETEPLTGGLFVGDLTVEPFDFDKGEPVDLAEVTNLAILRNLNMTVARLERDRKHYD